MESLTTLSGTTSTSPRLASQPLRILGEPESVSDHDIETHQPVLRRFPGEAGAERMLELAEQGKPAGQLGWGVRTEEERDLVREAARRVLAGHGLMTIARDWNERGLAGRRSRP